MTVIEEKQESQEEFIEEATDIAESLEHDTNTVKRIDLPLSIRKAAEQHISENLRPKAEKTVLEGQLLQKASRRPA